MREKLAAPLAGIALVGMLLAAADDLEQLKAKLDRQKNPADRARTTVKIGRILLEQAALTYREERYQDGAVVLEEYLGYVRRAHDELVASGRNARKKPKGFKELELHLRKATLQLDDLARSIHWEERPPVEAAKKEVEAIWEKLVRALFDLPPGPPGATEEKKP